MKRLQLDCLGADGWHPIGTILEGYVKLRFATMPDGVTTGFELQLARADAARFRPAGLQVGSMYAYDGDVSAIVLIVAAPQTIDVGLFPDLSDEKARACCAALRDAAFYDVQIDCPGSAHHGQTYSIQIPSPPDDTQKSLDTMLLLPTPSAADWERLAKLLSMQSGYPF